jgi:hypothetical protein
MPTTYAIPNGSTAFAATLWTGTQTTQSINNAVNGVGFQPDLVWNKSRSNADFHNVFDSVRGGIARLVTNNTNAESSTGNGFAGITSTGFNLDGSGGGGDSNASGRTYVGWQWKAGGTPAVTNTAGSITSQVSANTAAGFSVVTYTGNGTAGATIGHGLGAAPNFVIIKCRSNVTNWFVGGSNIAAAGNGTWSSVLEGLNTTAAISTGATGVFNSTAPSSSVITLGTETNANGNGRTFVIYAWAAVPGYSAFGSYTGNGSTDGPFQYLGFRPRFIMFKRTDSANVWSILDSTRDTYNVTNLSLQPNNSIAEETGKNIDYLSNGFKQRQTDGGWNASGGTYIYAAFAENPFKFSNAR